MARQARNEGLERVLGSLPGPAAYHCECGEEDCIERIVLEREAYRQIRADPRRFVVVHGHEQPARELVVADRGRYLVVRTVPARRDAVAEDARD